MDKIPVRNIQQSLPEPQFTGNFSIRRIEELLDGAAMVQQLHRHDYYHVLIIENGFGKHEIDFINYDIAPYSLFFMRPGQVHQLTLEPGSNGYLIQFDHQTFAAEPSKIKQILRTASSRNFCRVSPEIFQKLKLILEIISTEYKNRENSWHDAILSAMRIFLIEIIRSRQSVDITKSPISYQHEKLEALFELLECNILKTRQVSDYAEMLNASMYQLNSITKTTLNKTPSDLINAHIILEAKRQLLATTNQVIQIAYSLGYEDASYFIRFFKKHTGMSPEAFRKNLR